MFLGEFQELAAPRKPYGDPDAVTRRLRAVLQASPTTAGEPGGKLLTSRKYTLSGAEP